jgi:hypothetical protein
MTDGTDLYLCFIADNLEAQVERRLIAEIIGENPDRSVPNIPVVCVDSIGRPMLRRLHPEQPDSFAFTPANQAWAEAQITKYPEGRQASAIIPLLWRAQEQEGWLTRPAIEHVCDMLGHGAYPGRWRSRPSTSCSSSPPWARSPISRSAARRRA